MKTLEIQLGEDVESKRNILQNFVGRVVIVQHTEYGRVKGKIESRSEDHFDVRKPTNDTLAALYAKVYTLNYEKITKVSLVKPTIPDYIDEERRRIIRSSHVS